MLNTLRLIFVWFYCLPISDIILLIAFATHLFLLIHRFQHKHVLWSCFVFILLVAWITIITYATVSGREAAGHDTLSLIPFHSYREVLNGGNPEILRSNFMNAVLFYPAGLMSASLLPDKWPRWVRMLLPLLLFAGLSSEIEYVQHFYGIGRAEIDDVIHNSMGALVGSIFAVFRLKIPQLNDEQK